MPDESIDLLICNHVLEHVPDVGIALGEIRRVLRPGGVAILQVPIAMRLETTIELPLDSSPEERIARTGQADHLRLFTAGDYLATLEGAGMRVERYDPFAADAVAATEWRLDPFELLHLCYK